MATLQNDIEKIIKDNVAQMAGKQQRNSLHIAHQYHELLEELYDKDPDAFIFVNHFGHVEYHNPSFSKMMMLDKYDKAFSNIYNMDQLPISFELKDELLKISYPNGLEQYKTFRYKVVHFQKSILLQLTFKDQTPIYDAKDAYKALKTLTNHYLSHLTTPMFLVNGDDVITHVPDVALTIFGQPISQLQGESMFEALPFDYANQVKDKIKNITKKINGHFMYQTEHDKIIKAYDTTIHCISEELFLCQLTDVSDLNTMSSTIEYLNSYDSLSGFYNSNYYENTLSTIKDSAHLPLGIYTLTLHGLKQVNRKMGRHHCDNLLIAIALNIKSIISQHEIPCRISGDTFIIFFPNCSQSTLDRFTQKMTRFIDDYKKENIGYYLTYAEKTLLVADKTEDLGAIIKGLLL